MRRRHFNATQKLRVFNQIDSNADRAYLEHEILRCSSGKISSTKKKIYFLYLELTNFRKNYDLRSALQWRQHVQQTRVKVRRYNCAYDGRGK